jgi:hypothetical protein
MRTNPIFSTALALVLAVTAPLSAQEPGSADQPKSEHTSEDASARREAERQLREAERQLHDAERAMQEAARKMAELSAERTQALLNKRVVVFGDNARLGLVLRSDHDAKSDAVGAVVQGLTPGGPAEEAGLQPGDIIVAFNGEALAAAGHGASSSDAVKGGVQGGVEGGASGGESPTDRLMEHAATLKEGENVTLEVKRGDATKTLTVTARRLFGPRVRVFNLEKGTHDGLDFDYSYDGPEPPEPPEAPEAPAAPEVIVGSGPTWFSFGSSLSGLEMLTLNPDLGEYFGTTKGVLVIRAKEDSPYKLKAGDVILKVGDRSPSSPEQTIRILRSYGPGETVPIEVMRKHERVTLSVVLPQHRRGALMYSAPLLAPAAVDAPVALAAPAVPVAPAHAGV